MSKDTGHQDDTHDTPIKTPKQLIVVILLAFVLPVLLLIMLANLVTFTSRESSGSDAMTAEATQRRIAPVAGYAFVDANAPKVFKTGEAVYAQTCTACHTAGVAGAPKVGDNAGWTALIASGLDEMVAVAIKGKGGMPAKGGNPALSDYEVARAVVFMANKSGGNFDEPPAPDSAGKQASNAAATPAAASASAPSSETGGKTESATASSATAPGNSPEQATTAAGAASASAAAGAGATAPAPATAQAPAAAPAAINPAGEKLYKTVCLACHAAGVAGAPKFGDKAALAPYIAKGEDAMLKIVLSGKGAMPPKGGAMNASESDLRAAVQYMVNAAK